MRKMKDSGIDWIGEIPEGWEVRKLKYVANIQTGNTPSKSNDDNYVENGLLWVKPDNLSYYNDIIETNEKLSEQGRNSARIAKPYATLVCCIGSVGKLGYSSQSVAYNQQINAVEFDEKQYYWKYGLYYLSTQTEQHQYYMNGNVVYILNSESHKKLLVPYLELSEQQRIADYLDKKCKEIDAVIESKETTNENLKEYRKSIIYEAVTKGIDETVKMKDSSIEWIGEIPEGWEVNKAKYLFEEGENGIKIGPFGSALKGKTLEEGPYKIYNQANLIQGNFSLDRHFVSEETYDELSGYIISAGDVVFSMMGTIGKCSIIPDDLPQGIMDSHLMKTRLNNKMLPKYFQYVYDKDNSPIVIEQLLCKSNGSIMNGLNSSIVKNLYLPLPNIDEQQQISDYLDKKCAEIDSVIKANEDTIKKLKQYRQSIIYEAVTGKVEVGPCQNLI